MSPPKTFRIAVISDIHYAGIEEREHCANFYVRQRIKRPAARLAARLFHRFIWLHKHGGHNHLLDKFLTAVAGASLPPLRHEVGERDGVRWRQGIGGEASPHAVRGEHRFPKTHPDQGHEPASCSAGVPPASSSTVSVQDSGGGTPPEPAAGTAALPKVHGQTTFSPVDLVVANGDYCCDVAQAGVSDPAAFASAEECLGKLRARFGQNFRATLGDHELGKTGLFTGTGSMTLASWRRATENLGIEPFWRVQFGKYVLLGITSSLVALPVFNMDLAAGDGEAWERLRENHLAQIRDTFTGLKPGERVILFCHDPSALPFLWREETVRQKISQVEQTIIGHLHTNLVLRAGRVLAGFPTISFLGKGARRISVGLGEAKLWKPFRVRLCPAPMGIQLLKDGGWLSVELDADATNAARFEFHPLKW